MIQYLKKVPFSEKNEVWTPLLGEKLENAVVIEINELITIMYYLTDHKVTRLTQSIYEF